MPQMRVAIQDLLDGDIILPSRRKVLNVTITPDTPNGYRVVELGTNDLGHGDGRFVFPAENVITIERVE